MCNWAQRKGNVLAMIEQFGNPTLFLTLSMSELHIERLVEFIERLKVPDEARHRRVDAMAS